MFLTESEFLKFVAQQAALTDQTIAFDALLHFTLGFAKYLGLSKDDTHSLKLGVYLHDLGKILIPPDILNHRGKFTTTQRLLMQAHVLLGVEMISGIAPLTPVIPIVAGHHERWNGSGYPLGLKGEDIPVLARIFSICDIWVALTEERPYKPKFSTAEALRIIEQEALEGLHSPQIVENLKGFLASKESENGTLLAAQ